ncbi:hypothetical protein CMU30_13910 [Elizabethkingia anophelis]|nr:hypothetical protein [Elizabethkingia anophelis]MDV3684374.1 hypothetical protein [Elizabethkingia anophelis]MDV3699717.1 hypothetical protein [Elizabethkingia anophelis]MDV3763630.1 hypothetical protein [Elizabethkingia anophelis]MDV3802635.1 hypothetical protein [Elizabethkingia anophelis]
MKKVIVEITETGYKVSVTIEEQTFTEVHERTKSGARRMEGDFEEVEEMSEELYDSLSGFTFYDIMEALNNNP